MGTPPVSEERLGADELFRSHASFVAKFLARLGTHPQDIDDLVQEVFMTAHRRGGFVPGAARPTTWLAEIAVRVASTKRRTKRRRPEEPDAEAAESVPSAMTPERSAESRESLERVQAAIDKLGIDKRAVFVLFELEGESCDSIAAGLDIPVSTVYSRLHTARREFKEAYARLTRDREAPVAAEPGNG